GKNILEVRPERPSTEELDAESFADAAPLGSMAPIEKNWFDCIRSGGTPHANIDLAIRAHTVLCLAEMSERLSLTLLYDEATRAVRTGEGKAVKRISYDSIVPDAA